MNRNTWNGSFRLQTPRADHWIVRSSEPAPVEVQLLGVQCADAAAAPALAWQCVNIQWRDGAAAVTLSGESSGLQLLARAAFVHEPRPALYAALPLESFGPRAQSFWKRVFLLVKLPGGRVLLNLIARRARA
jgi:hypothetical protein